MASVTISSRFQIVIPREIRRALGLVPGQRVDVRLVGDHIEIVPLPLVNASPNDPQASPDGRPGSGATEA
ncbi:AbrB/MazE/SpoVT family DNA-binding domain-containing protein [Sphaerotilus sp.]|jgi:AbrB family looped-hinge helix DNA binding protein|uniref:AbrB/MazE/SpoVT family DNA-binding domain-containing protein n=1 Tax=Sphaerotilus sp. TaxID=2093942 RepID=UPI003446CD1F